MVAPSSALRTVSAKRITASRTTADRVSPIPAATSSSSNPISSSLNLVGTGVVTRSSIQFVEQYAAAMYVDDPQGRGRTPFDDDSGAGVGSGATSRYGAGRVSRGDRQSRAAVAPRCGALLMPNKAH